jgi:hypothetical protein
MSIRRLFPTLLYEADIRRPCCRSSPIRSARSPPMTRRAGSGAASIFIRATPATRRSTTCRRRDPAFGDLAKLLTRHAPPSPATLAWGAKPKLDSLWANLLENGGHHSGHIHPHSIFRARFYVEVPAGSGAIRFEDPRLR